MLMTWPSRLCATGDATMCNVMRSWLWDGIMTMLIDAGVESGSPEYEQAYTAFVRGEEGPTDPQL